MNLPETHSPVALLLGYSNCALKLASDNFSEKYGFDKFRKAMSALDKQLLGRLRPMFDLKKIGDEKIIDYLESELLIPLLCEFKDPKILKNPAVFDLRARRITRAVVEGLQGGLCGQQEGVSNAISSGNVRKTCGSNVGDVGTVWFEKDDSCD